METNQVVVDPKIVKLKTYGLYGVVGVVFILGILGTFVPSVREYIAIIVKAILSLVGPLN